ncbi:MAG: hypothetical protein MUC29_12480 [Pyrinomonadaceae bacterium]|jgi:hypothetical protein|nr:hypothetical protein [Pyrinomonadaceae bacterium]
MELFDEKKENKSYFKNLFIFGGFAIFILLGILVIIFILGGFNVTKLIAVSRPTSDVVVDQLENPFREGSPEFAELKKKIIAETVEDQTTEAQTGLGRVNMYITGKIRNITGKSITGLEVNVAVVTLENKPIKERTIIIVPNQIERLENNKAMVVKLNMEGFRKDDDRANIRWKVTGVKTE